MPRFFFNIFDGRGHLDTLGAELPDTDAAQTYAIRHAGEVLQSEASSIRPHADWRLEVTDEAGCIILCLDFNVTLLSASENASTARSERSSLDPEG